ncbi:MAG: triple tyrosine motif-containing protein, partial [Chitinophagaceae bacterium]
LGVIDFSGTSPETIFFPELEGKMVSGNEHIYPYDKFNIFVGAEKGFYHINFDAYKQNSNPLQIRIRSVKAFGKKDSLLYGGYHNNINETIYQDIDAIPEINNKWNSFRFEYASPVYEHLNSVLYSYFLDGFDEQWSAWSKKPEKEYTNLPGGSYIFKVKTKNNLGEESAITMFRFKVLPPWFLSVWAYFLYSSALIAIVYLIHKHQKKKFLRQQEKHEKEQKQLQYLHQLELEQSEKEIVKLKNEKLQAEIEHKNKELASTAMHLVQKGEFLTKIKEELLHMKGAVVENGSSGDVKKILKKLSEEEKVDKDWEQFATYFDQLHHDFLKKLKEHYPNLSASELKLCAYLLMNLSSKEIAQLMNISGRGVEISRYRLRKKLQIPTETNLYNFLLEFSS